MADNVVTDRPPTNAAWINRLGPGPLDPQPEPDKGGTNGTPANTPGTNGNGQPVAPGGTPPAAAAAAPAGPVTPPQPAASKPAASGDDDIDKEEAPRDQAGWERFKTKYKGRTADLMKELSTREAKIKEYETVKADLEKKLGEKPSQDPAIEKRIKELETLVEKQREAISMSDIENDPQFKAYYTDRLNGIIETAKSLVGDEKAADFERLIKLPEGEYKTAQLRVFLDDFEDDWVKDDIRAEIRKYRDLSAEREKERTKWNEHGKTIKTRNEKTKQEQFQNFQKTVTKAFDDEIARLQDPKIGSFMWQKQEGAEAEAWNKSIDQRIESAKKLMMSPNVTPADMAQGVLNAVAHPVLLAAFLQERQRWASEISKLEAQVKALSAANPTAGAGGAPGGEPVSSAKPGMNPHQRSKAWAADMAKAMATAQSGGT